MTLMERAASLKRLAVTGITTAQIQQCTNFAIDALEADAPHLALDVLTALSLVAPRSSIVWQLLALCYRAEGGSAAAHSAFAKAAALAPQDAKIATGLATTALEAGYPSALLFKAARDLALNDPELLLSTANALVADGHTDVAEMVLVQNIAANPDWVRGHDALATLRWTRTGADDFARSFAEGVASQPHNLALRIGWQRALAQAEHWEAAKAVIANGRHAIGDCREFDAAEAHIATEIGDDTKAGLLFDRTAGFDDPSTKISHIRHCLRVGDIDRAAQIAEALLVTPAATMAWPYMGLIWRLRGDQRAAWLDGDPPMIGVYDLPFAAEALHSLAAHLRTLHRTRHHPAEQSLRGGTQTEGNLFSRVDPELARVRTVVLDAVRDYAGSLPKHDAGHPLLGPLRDGIRFAGSWSVRLTSQGFHICHTHPMGWISSAFYVSLPGPEELGAAPAGWLELGAAPADLRLDLPAYQRVEPKPGRLVLFPSTMWHGTIPFADGERLTIAFDVARPR
jgi:Tfp pilus assembly protein PilF